jgi:membrane associated rhomboid family serine protease
MLDGIFFAAMSIAKPNGMKAVRMSELENQPDAPVIEHAATEEIAPPRSEPIFNIPAILIFFIGLMVVIELVRDFLLPPAWDYVLVMEMAFRPVRYITPLADQNIAGWLIGPLGYSLLHGGFVHLIFNCVWLAAFATPLAQRIGSVRFILLWVTSAIFSAFFQAFITDFANIVLIGASGVVSATVGAACRFSLALSGTSSMRFARFAPRLGIFEALTYRPVIMFILMWVLSNALVVYGAGVPTQGYNVAWQAHVGGFLFGYLTFGFFDTQRGQ